MKIISSILEKYSYILLILNMDINDLIESNPTLFRVIAILGGLIIGYIIYILQS